MFLSSGGDVALDTPPFDRAKVATTGRFSLSTTARALMDLNMSGASCIGSIHNLRETSLSYIKIRICAPCSFQGEQRIIHNRTLSSNPGFTLPSGIPTYHS